MKKFKVLFFIICIPCFVYSQQWQVYSDSVLVNFKKNNIEKVKYFIGLADTDMQQNIVIKDTLYADYIYRKGIVKSLLGDYDSTLLKQSLDIWELSSKKNYLKIMKINYWLGTNYYSSANQSQNKTEMDSSYIYLKKCYSLIKKYNYQKQQNFTGVLNLLAIIDYSNKEFEQAKKYAIEYVDYIKKTGVGDFNFDYVYILTISKDFIGQENLLQEYLAKYEIQ